MAKALAERDRPAVVINADSAQVYADLAVLSARPTVGEMSDVPHRLFGTWDGAIACSAADWAAAARTEVDAAHAQGAVPILVGGTGLYLQTLLEGIAPVPSINPAIREEVRALPTPAAYADLQRLDPARAGQLAPADSARIARSLEVIRSTGRSLLDWQAKRSGGIADRIALHAILMLPPRAELSDRCNARFAAMLEQGAIAAVDALLTRQLDPALPVMRAIGVLEIAALLHGECNREQALERGAQATRNYAKRQFTWFRGQSPQDWQRVETFYPDPMRIFELLLQH